MLAVANLFLVKKCPNSLTKLAGSYRRFLLHKFRQVEQRDRFYAGTSPLHNNHSVSCDSWNMGEDGLPRDCVVKAANLNRVKLELTIAHPPESQESEESQEAYEYIRPGSEMSQQILRWARNEISLHYGSILWGNVPQGWQQAYPREHRAFDTFRSFECHWRLNPYQDKQKLFRKVVKHETKAFTYSANDKAYLFALVNEVTPAQRALEALQTVANFDRVQAPPPTPDL